MEKISHNVYKETFKILALKFEISFAPLSLRQQIFNEWSNKRILQDFGGYYSLPQQPALAMLFIVIGNG